MVKPLMGGPNYMAEHREEALIENYYDLLEAGESRERACERLGVKWNSLERIMHRREKRTA